MGVLGLLILGFGVWRAWREAAQVVIPVEGPFTLAPPQPEPVAAAPEAPVAAAVPTDPT